jgi:aryl-phospho-beta-D-glucosidase BglC (GH1 family)
MMRNKSILILLMIIMASQVFADGFLKTNGKKIVNSSGQEVYLRGINLGNWFLQEGYMMQTSSFANAERQLRAKISALVGTDNMNEFYKAWYDNYITKKDIDQIAAWGFNSIRLPLHYNKLTPENQPGVYLEEGFAYIDSCLSWCEQNKIYLILDLHAAPGSQNGEGISDEYDGNAKLWTVESNKTRTIELWGKLAQRYKDKEWIGGYDLLNETKYQFPSGNGPLWDLLKNITTEVRKYDTKHMVFIEGNWYANDYTDLPATLWDNNLVISFHKYWNETSASTISSFVSLSNKYNVPLWLGESGENSNGWFTETIQLMETYNIGYAFWPYKKIGSISGLTTIDTPADYKTLLNYWGGSGAKPSVENAKKALMNLVNHLKFENCKLNTDVVDAMFRQVNSDGLEPFADNKVPGVIYGVNYDLGKSGIAYSDKIYKNTNNSDAYNSGWTYRNDGVDIEACSDIFSNGYNVGWIESGEYLKYTIDAEKSGQYQTTFRVAGSSAGGKMIIRVDNVVAGTYTTVPATGGYQSWSTINGPNINLTAGKHVLQIQFLTGGFNFNNMEFSLLSTDVCEEKNNKPNEYELQQNYPNPFNPVTNISYNIPESGMVNVSVYNITGQKVAELVNEEKQAGRYNIQFNAANLASGVYYYRINVNQFTSTHSMVVLK